MKKISYIALYSLILLAVCGCYELGDFDSNEYYYECFPTVSLIDKNKIIQNYEVEEYFYTEEGINEYKSDVPYKEYLYFYVQVKKDMLLDEFNLSFCSNQDCVLEISVFILDSFPTNIQGYDDPSYDEENNKIEYGDPVDALDTKVLNLTAEKWLSTYMINRPRNDLMAINEGQYIVLRFENNSFLGKEKGLSLVTFTTTNLLIRAQGSEE